MATDGRPPGAASTRDCATKSKRSEKERRLDLTFLTSAAEPGDAPATDAPEVAVAGRSNAGKSSVLNRLAGRRQLARVSKTPGRTQLLNFFEVRGGGRLVDLPGYGYAKAGRDAQARWQRTVNGFLNYRESLVGVVLVMDVRHPFQAFDEELIDWATASGLELLVLLNKADKLKAGARAAALQKARRRLTPKPGVSVQCYSAQTGLGQAEAIDWLTTVLRRDESAGAGDED